MIWTTIKSNFKLMFRNKLVLLLAIFGPVLIIAALSSAFHDLLNTGHEKTSFTLGYAIANESQLTSYKEQIFGALDKQDITCKEYPASMAKSSVSEGKVDVFLLADKQGNILYSQKTGGVDTRICQYALNQFDNGVKVQKLAMEDRGKTEKVSLKETSMPVPKTAQASDYYGIIEMVYFIWICMIFLSPIVQSERKNHIQSRFIASPATNGQLYLGKFIPCALMGVTCTAVSIVISTYLFDIHWGNYGMSAVILLLTVLAATAFGMLCLYIVNNLAVSVVALFVVVWLAGFVGGSFETYMFSGWAESIKRLSPLYYANRTLVEYSTNGSSEYTVPCIIFLSALTLIFAVLGLLLMKRRMEER